MQPKLESRNPFRLALASPLFNPACATDPEVQTHIGSVMVALVTMTVDVRRRIIIHHTTNHLDHRNWHADDFPFAIWRFIYTPTAYRSLLAITFLRRHKL